MFPQKIKNFSFGHNYKLLGGALGVIITALLFKKYLSSGPSQDDNSKASLSETQIAL